MLGFVGCVAATLTFRALWALSPLALLPQVQVLLWPNLAALPPARDYVIQTFPSLKVGAATGSIVVVIVQWWVSSLMKDFYSS